MLHIGDCLSLGRDQGKGTIDSPFPNFLQSTAPRARRLAHAVKLDMIVLEFDVRTWHLLR